MDIMLWHEKAGAQYMYYVLSLVWLDPPTPPPSLSLSLSLSVATGTDPLPPSLSLRMHCG